MGLIEGRQCATDKGKKKAVPEARPRIGDDVAGGYQRAHSRADGAGSIPARVDGSTLELDAEVAERHGR
jgi:hypothetical protein